MSAFSIVPSLDIRENGLTRLGVGAPRASADEFELEGGKETLCNRVVPAIAGAAHARLNVVRREQVSSTAGRLDPARPFERRLRAILRDDLLVVADARAQTAEDAATLATALRAIAPLR